MLLFFFVTQYAESYCWHILFHLKKHTLLLNRICVKLSRLKLRRQAQQQNVAKRTFKFRCNMFLLILFFHLFHSKVSATILSFKPFHWLRVLSRMELIYHQNPHINTNSKADPFVVGHKQAEQNSALFIMSLYDTNNLCRFKELAVGTRGASLLLNPAKGVRKSW